ncbi:MAG TPA: hypothetical protein VI757_15125 [Bacteroidia bacterium]|nr:hypothetical protein [Bacteroidia bacterium]
MRIEIPRKAKKLMKLGKDIAAKHLVDGPASPLDNADVTAMDALLSTATTADDQSEQLHRDAETATEGRDNALGIGAGQNIATIGTIINYVRKFRNRLTGKFLGEEHRLGDWGYTVDTSPPPPPPPPPAG